LRVLRALGLAPICIAVEPRNDMDRKLFLAELPRLLAQGIRLIQIRDLHASPDQRIAFARRIGAAAKPFRASILLAGSALEARRAGVSGIYSTASELRRLVERPPASLWGASCRDEAGLARAIELGADFAAISPVLPTASHRNLAPLGWDGLQRLARTVPIPVFAQGGLTPAHLAEARQAGAAGVVVNFNSFYAGGEHGR
jgi:8-oxo-dGTP diphosphatase